MFLTLLATLGLSVLSGCDSGKPQGYYFIIELENSENIKQYSVYNPYLHSVAECESTANKAIAQIMNSDPPVIPTDSKITSWRCSLLPPDRGG